MSDEGDPERLSDRVEGPSGRSISHPKNHIPKPRNQTGSQTGFQWKGHRQSKRTITMATWNVQGCRGKMQEIIKEMEQLRINMHLSRKQKRKVLDQKLLETVYIFVAASQKKTGRREESLY